MALHKAILTFKFQALELLQVLLNKWIVAEDANLPSFGESTMPLLNAVPFGSVDKIGIVPSAKLVP